MAEYQFLEDPLCEQYPEVCNAYKKALERLGASESGVIDSKNIPNDIPDDNHPGKVRLPTLPHIGSNYSKKNPLFICLETGKDPGHVSTLNERRFSIESDPITHNPHITGTYIQSLFLLKEQINYSHWNKIKQDARIEDNGLENVEEYLPETNPLSLIALTNRYKFAPVGSDSHTDTRASFMDVKEIQTWLLKREIEVLNPGKIVVQGKVSRDNHVGASNSLGFVKKAIKESSTSPEVIHFYHPGYLHRSRRISDINALVADHDW